MRELIFERSTPGIENVFLPPCLKAPEQAAVDRKFISDGSPELPEVGELDIIRHYMNLSKLNFSVDTNFYPLGSCTMKYNPKINEEIAGWKEFSHLHPYLPEEHVQGMLEIIWELQESLKDISGLQGVSLTPAAGAHGELAGNFIIAKYFRERGEKRHIMLIPDSAHGTNPASAVMAGFTPVEVASDKKGDIDIEALKGKLSPEVAGIMMTQPNTLGIFDSNFRKIADLVHAAGGLVYMDGANMNAMMCHVKPGEIGVDVMHFNLHKTFSTPHGMGGPGSGPVAVGKKLVPYLPVPVAEKDSTGIFRLEYGLKNTIGQIKEGYGNIGVMLRALVYILALGRDGLKEAADIAVLNANYLKARLVKHFHLQYDGITKHEFVLDNEFQKGAGVKTLDIAKRLLDYGYHAPTVYFPLIVHEAIMIEPTETESKKALDDFADTMIRIAEEAKSDPGILKNAPVKTPIRRPDEVKAAKNPVLKWTKK